MTSSLEWTHQYDIAKGIIPSESGGGMGLERGSPLDRITAQDAKPYWTNPVNVAMHYNAWQADTTGFDWSKVGINTDFLSRAYTYLKETNKGLDITQWALPQDDYFLSVLDSTPAPIESAKWSTNTYQGLDYKSLLGDLYTAIAPEATKPPVTPDEQYDWESLPSWQKTIYTIRSNSVLSAVSTIGPIALLGAATAGFALGPVAVGAAAVGAGALAGYLQTEQANKLLTDLWGTESAEKIQEKSEQILRILNWPAEQIEMGVGIAAQFYDDVVRRDVSFSTFLQDYEAIKEASRLTYETGLASAGTAMINSTFVLGEWLSDKLTGQPMDVKFADLDDVWVVGQAQPQEVPGMLQALRLARTEISRNPAAPVLSILSKYTNMYGESGAMADLVAQTIADPLNLSTAPIQRSALKGLASALDDPILRLAADASKKYHGGIVRAMRLYPDIAQHTSGLHTPTKFQQVFGNLTPTGAPDVAATAGGLLGKFVPPWKKFNTLTKESQAKIAAAQGIDSINYVAGIALDNPALWESFVDGLVGKVNWEDIEVTAQLFDTPLIRHLKPLLNEFNMEAYDAIRKTRALGQEKLTALRSLADRMSMNIEDLAAKLSDPKVIKQVNDLLTADKTLFTAGDIADYAKFFDENPWAINNEHYLAHAQNVMMDSFRESLVKHYGLHPGSTLDRVLAASKGLQSLVLLSFSPSYFINNVLSDTVNRIYDGIGGWTSAKEIDEYFARLHQVPARLAAGIGAGDIEIIEGQKMLTELAKTKLAITKAMRGNDLAQRAKDFASAKASTIGIFTRWAGVWEQADSKRAFYAAHRKAYPLVMQHLIRDFTPAERAHLQTAGVNPDQLRGAINAAMNTVELADIFDGTPFTLPEVFYKNVAERTTQGVADLMRETGVFDTIKKRLELGESAENAVMGIKDDLVNKLGEKMAEDLPFREQLVQDSIAKDPANMSKYLYSVMDADQRMSVAHSVEMEIMWETGKDLKGKDLSHHINKGLDRSDKYWEYHHRWRQATYAGVIRGLGTADDIVLKATQRLSGIDNRWKDYSKTTRERWAKFAEHWKDKDRLSMEFVEAKTALQKELADLYEEYALKEFVDMHYFSSVFAKSVADKFGPNAFSPALNYMERISAGQEYLRQTVSSFRAWERGDLPNILIPEVQRLVKDVSPARKSEMWPRFYSEVLMKAVSDSIIDAQYAAIDLMNNLGGVQPSRMPIPDTPQLYKDLLKRRIEEVQAYLGVRKPVTTPPPPEPPPGTPPIPPAPPPKTPYKGGLTELSFRTQMEQALDPLIREGAMTAEQVAETLNFAVAHADAWVSIDPEIRTRDRFFSKYSQIVEAKAADFAAYNAERVKAGKAPLSWGELYGTAHVSMTHRNIKMYPIKTSSVGVLLHELWHTFLYDITFEDAKIWFNHLKVDISKMTPNNYTTYLDNMTDVQHEKWANYGVQYAQKPEPTPLLGHIFSKFAGWLTALYNKTMNQPDKYPHFEWMYMDVPPEIMGIFDRMLRQRHDSTLASWEGRTNFVSELTKDQLYRYGWVDSTDALLKQVNIDAKALGIKPYASIAELSTPAFLQFMDVKMRPALFKFVQRAEQELLSDNALNIIDKLKFTEFDGPSYKELTGHYKSRGRSEVSVKLRQNLRKGNNVRNYSITVTKTMPNGSSTVRKLRVSPDQSLFDAQVAVGLFLANTESTLFGMPVNQTRIAYRAKELEIMSGISSRVTSAPMIEDILQSNKSSSMAHVPKRSEAKRLLEDIADPSMSILDFGSGKEAPYTTYLREKGFDITAHEMGTNFVNGVHDQFALSRQYDIVLADNVINAQTNEGMLDNTLETIMDAVYPEGRAIISLPKTPRYDMYSGLPYTEINQMIVDKLSQYGYVRVYGTEAAPVFEVVKTIDDPQIASAAQRYTSTTPDILMKDVRQFLKSDAKLKLGRLDDFIRELSDEFGDDIIPLLDLENTLDYRPTINSSTVLTRQAFIDYVNSKQITGDTIQLPVRDEVRRTAVQEKASKPSEEYSQTPFEIYPGMGDIAKVGAYAHQFEIESDAYHAYLGPGLNAYILEAGQGSGVSKFNLSALSPEGKKAIQKYRSEAIMGQLKASSIANGISERVRDFSLLNYDKRYNSDAPLSAWAPYQFWFTRTMVEYGMRFMDRPAIMSFFARFGDYLSAYKDEDQLDIPAKLRGRLKLPFAHAVGWSDGDLYINPWRKIFPFMELTIPFESLITEQYSLESKATSVLYSMVRSEEITAEQAQAAIENPDDPLWQVAMNQAVTDSDMNTMDYMSMFLSPALYISIPQQLINGHPERIGPFPPSRTLQALSAATGIELFSKLDLEAKIKENNGLSKFGEYGDYYTDRQLYYMSMEGEITPNQAIIAMIEKKGPYWDTATKRVGEELMSRMQGALAIGTGIKFLQGKAGLEDMLGTLLLSWLPGDVIAKSELETKGLYKEYNRARVAYNNGNPDALSRFYDSYPQFAVRSASRKDPEERYKQFAIQQIWDVYGNATELEKRAIKDQFGLDFQDFLASETEQIPLSTLVSWAQALTPEMPESTIPTAEYNPPTPEVSQLVEMYYNEQERLFPGLRSAMNYAYTLDKPERNAILNRLPMRDRARWQDDFFEAFPEVQQYVSKTDEMKNQEKALSNYVKIYPSLYETLEGVAFGRTPTSGELQFMSVIWKRLGQPEDSFEDWLKLLGVTT